MKFVTLVWHFTALAAWLPVLQAQTSVSSASPEIHLNVAVTANSKLVPSGLTAQDFKVLDNKMAMPIDSFKAVSSDQEPVRIILLIDAVNARFTTVGYEREQVKKYLKSNGGTLAHPTAIAILTDKGAEIQKSFTRDGNALNAELDRQEIGLREITPSSGYYGAQERLQISLTAISQLTSYASALPGRKLVVWISPGWPLLSGVRADLSAKQQQQIFGDILAFSRRLRDANMTLYNINPVGVEEGLLRQDYYENFLRGISKPGQTDLGDLGLQVLAVQSGGLALEGSTDITGMLQRCTAEADSWYEIDFKMPPADKPNTYHQVEVQVDKPGWIARTRQGYYSQP